MTKRLIRNVYTAILGMETTIKMVLAIMSHEVVLLAIVTLIKQAHN